MRISKSVYLLSKYYRARAAIQRDITRLCTVLPRFTYGKGVLGSLDVKLGICSETSSKVFVFKQAQFDLWPSVVVLT